MSLSEPRFHLEATLVCGVKAGKVRMQSSYELSKNSLTVSKGFPGSTHRSLKQFRYSFNGLNESSFLVQQVRTKGDFSCEEHLRPPVSQHLKTILKWPLVVL